MKRTGLGSQEAAWGRRWAEERVGGGLWGSQVPRQGDWTEGQQSLSLGTQRPNTEAWRQLGLHKSELRRKWLRQQRAGRGDCAPRIQLDTLTGEQLGPHLNKERGSKYGAGVGRCLSDLTADSISWEVNQGPYAARS